MSTRLHHSARRDGNVGARNGAPALSGTASTALKKAARIVRSSPQYAISLGRIVGPSEKSHCVPLRTASSSLRSASLNDSTATMKAGCLIGGYAGSRRSLPLLVIAMYGGAVEPTKRCNHSQWSSRLLPLLRCRPRHGSATRRRRWFSENQRLEVQPVPAVRNSPKRLQGEEFDGHSSQVLIEVVAEEALRFVVVVIPYTFERATAVSCPPTPRSGPPRP